ncbi:AI-2E family transporter [Paraphotobacterium marinum]|uniref:AI-2E family transporter n=1 Tax=Paraphotobacterium marinum TaxID=1755811 RepID=A0A220VCU2_9GAMM|nr:AI-2E family transporter [Paraphotobacterium marinum]ASK77793.1 AI-2E family transporter [Paraphotobacterium marinum]
MIKNIVEWNKKYILEPNNFWFIFTFLVISLGVFYLGGYLLPFFVAVILSFLLDVPVNLLESLKVKRSYAVTIVLSLSFSLVVLFILYLFPLMWNQVMKLIGDFPSILTRMQKYLFDIPNQYPNIVSFNHIEAIIQYFENKLLSLSESLIKVSLNSLLSVVTILIYSILVPLLMFYLLKDKVYVLSVVNRALPKKRSVLIRVKHETLKQIKNYLIGKLIEILIVGFVSYMLFAIMGLNYSIVLALGVGFSVLIPYVGAVAITIPIIMIALAQFGLSHDFWWLISIYLIIQILDGNVLVPLLFSEAVSLHPIIIILSILVFGGIWGVLGVFFAIPLATFIKAVINGLLPES